MIVFLAKPKQPSEISGLRNGRWCHFRAAGMGQNRTHQWKWRHLRRLSHEGSQAQTGAPGVSTIYKTGFITKMVKSRISGLDNLLLGTPTGFLTGKILLKAQRTEKQEQCVKNQKELVPVLKNIVNIKISGSRWLQEKRWTAAMLTCGPERSHGRSALSRDVKPVGVLEQLHHECWPSHLKLLRQFMLHFTTIKGEKCKRWGAIRFAVYGHKIAYLCLLSSWIATAPVSPPAQSRGEAQHMGGFSWCRPPYVWEYNIRLLLEHSLFSVFFCGLWSHCFESFNFLH